jgi:hypothetical protein
VFPVQLPPSQPQPQPSAPQPQGGPGGPFPGGMFPQPSAPQPQAPPAQAGWATQVYGQAPQQAGFGGPPAVPAPPQHPGQVMPFSVGMPAGVPPGWPTAVPPANPAAPPAYQFPGHGVPPGAATAAALGQLPPGYQPQGQAFPAGQAPPPPPPPDPLHSELAQMRQRLATYESAEATRKAAEQQAEQQRLAQQGQWETLFKQHQAQMEAKDREYKEYQQKARDVELRRSLTAALAGRPLISPAAANQLVELWAHDFECVDGPGGFIVRHKQDFRTPELIAAERLSSPDWAHFVAAQQAGGAGAVYGFPAPTQPFAPGAAPQLNQLQQALLPYVQIPQDRLSVDPNRPLGLRGTLGPY